MREHLRWQLMLALYRSGRRADAPQAYRDGRQVVVVVVVVVDELGLEPSRELQRLQQAILTAELALAPAGPRLQPGPPGTGRDRLRRSSPRTWPGSPAATSNSASSTPARRGRPARAGSDRGHQRPQRGGKSALAVHAAHRLAGQFPDGQLYVDLRGASSRGPALEPLEALGRFIRALGLAGASRREPRVDLRSHRTNW